MRLSSTRRVLSTVMILLFLPGLAVFLAAFGVYAILFAAAYRVVAGKAPYWTNCIFWALHDWGKQIHRDWPTRHTAILPPGGFVAVCVSCYGNFPHVMRSPDQKKWHAWMPLAAHVHRLFPPLTFAGEVHAGHYRRQSVAPPS